MSVHWVIAFCLSTIGQPSPDVDLSRIERTIAKEPAYATKTPLYAMIALGADASRRVWVVLDGDVLYLDRNANADLTDAEDRHPVKKISHGNQPAYTEDRIFSVSGVPREAGAPQSSVDVYAQVSLFNLAYAWEDKAEQEVVALARRTTVPHIAFFSLNHEGKTISTVIFAMSESAAKAPILHFDGPLTLGRIGAYPLDLTRGDEPTELKVAVGTAGVGAGSLAYRTFETLPDIPETARPVADIEFPARGKDTFLPPRRIVLDGKC